MESQVNVLPETLNRYWNLVQTARCVLGFLLDRKRNFTLFLNYTERCRWLFLNTNGGLK